MVTWRTTTAALGCALLTTVTTATAAVRCDPRDTGDAQAVADMNTFVTRERDTRFIVPGEGFVCIPGAPDDPTLEAGWQRRTQHYFFLAASNAYPFVLTAVQHETLAANRAVRRMRYFDVDARAWTEYVIVQSPLLCLWPFAPGLPPGLCGRQ